MKQNLTDSRVRDVREGDAKVAVAGTGGVGVDPGERDPMWSVRILQKALLEFCLWADKNGSNPRRKRARQGGQPD